MKIQTQNKLAHYQCEYNEVYEQTLMLQNQIVPLQQQIGNMQRYLQVNGGDRKAMQDYKRLTAQLNTLNSSIRRNQTRLNTLSRQIYAEQNRMTMRANKQVYGTHRRCY